MLIYVVLVAYTLVVVAVTLGCVLLCRKAVSFKSRWRSRIASEGALAAQPVGVGDWKSSAQVVDRSIEGALCEDRLESTRCMQRPQGNAKDHHGGVCR